MGWSTAIASKEDASWKVQTVTKHLMLLFLVAAVAINYCASIGFEKSDEDSRYRLEIDAVITEKRNMMNHPNYLERIKYFRDTALKFDPVTDKIGGYSHSAHRYHNMYGIFLLPLSSHKPNFKMLEIGLGCNMGYGPGASVALWKDMFPHAILWEAEYVAECVEKAQERGQLKGINVLVGDQANLAVLDQWVEKSGGQFDVVIDDGGHHNCQISNSFDKLWAQVLPGGFYFIEDMHVGQWDKYISPDCGSVVMSQRLQSWMAQLIYQTTARMVKIQDKEKYPLPHHVAFVHCQAEACVVGKAAPPITDPMALYKLKANATLQKKAN